MLFGNTQAAKPLRICGARFLVSVFHFRSDTDQNLHSALSESENFYSLEGFTRPVIFVKIHDYININAYGNFIHNGDGGNYLFLKKPKSKVDQTWIPNPMVSAIFIPIKSCLTE